MTNEEQLEEKKKIYIYVHLTLVMFPSKRDGDVGILQLRMVDGFSVTAAQKECTGLQARVE